MLLIGQGFRFEIWENGFRSFRRSTWKAQKHSPPIQNTRGSNLSYILYGDFSHTQIDLTQPSIQNTRGSNLKSLIHFVWGFSPPKLIWLILDWFDSHESWVMTHLRELWLTWVMTHDSFSWVMTQMSHDSWLMSTLLCQFPFESWFFMSQTIWVGKFEWQAVNFFTWCFSISKKSLLTLT